MLLCVPIFFPIIKAVGFDPLWFGIIYNVNMQMSFLSPPFGYALFYMKGVTPRNKYGAHHQGCLTLPRPSVYRPAYLYQVAYNMFISSQFNVCWL